MKTINNKGWNPPTPLGECEGDCDRDSDCGQGMYCFNRNSVREAVPGCLGGENDLTLVDYCTYSPPLTSPPVAVNPTNPPTRRPTPSVPFPTNRPTKLPTKEPTKSPTKAPSEPLPALNNLGWQPPTPLGLCQGDCDIDADCGPGMYCFQRNAIRQEVPGCSGGDQDLTLVDYCTWRADLPTTPTNPPTPPPVPSPTNPPFDNVNDLIIHALTIVH